MINVLAENDIEIFKIDMTSKQEKIIILISACLSVCMWLIKIMTCQTKAIGKNRNVWRIIADKINSMDL